MDRSPLLLPVTAFSVAALLALTRVWAYRAASVSAPTGFVVAGTDQAVIALLPGSGDGNAAGTAFIASRRLQLDFSRGYLGGGGFGFADGDRYRFRGLFRVINAAAASRDVYIYVPGGGVDGLAGIYGRPEADPNAVTRWRRDGF